MFNEYEVIKATRNLTENVLIGCKGTILMVFREPSLAYEVEFVDDTNTTVELLTVKPNDIVKL